MHERARAAVGAHGGAGATLKPLRLLLSVGLGLAVWLLPIFGRELSKEQPFPSRPMQLSLASTSDAAHDVRPPISGSRVLVQEQRCLAVLVFIVSLWISEAIPYFVTSLLVPVIVIVSGIAQKSSATRTGSPRTAHAYNRTRHLALYGHLARRSACFLPTHDVTHAGPAQSRRGKSSEPCSRPLCFSSSPAWSQPQVRHSPCLAGKAITVRRAR